MGEAARRQASSASPARFTGRASSKFWSNSLRPALPAHSGERMPPSAKRRAYLRENRFEHLRRQHARIRVVARAMIAGGNPVGAKPARRPMTSGMIAHPARQRADGRVMRKLAQGHDGLEIWQGGNPPDQKAAAGIYLGCNRLILRRDTAHRIGDHAIDQLKTIIRPLAILASHKAEFRERWIEQIACIIAGERPPRPVCAANAGRKTNNQEPRGLRPEAVDRVIMPERMLIPQIMAIVDKPGTERTIGRRFGRLPRIGGSAGRKSLRCPQHLNLRRRRRTPWTDLARPGGADARSRPSVPQAR